MNVEVVLFLELASQVANDAAVQRRVIDSGAGHRQFYAVLRNAALTAYTTASCSL